MTSFFRQSKVKNTTFTLTNKTEHYDGLSPSILPHPDSNLLEASSTHLSFIHSSGACNVAVLPLAAKGKYASAEQNILTHSSTVEAFQFSPHHAQSILYTCTSDGTFSTFSPSKFERIYPSPISSFAAGLTNCAGIAHHPSASGILAVRGGNTINIVDVNSSKKLLSSSFSDSISSFDWSYDGSMLLTCCKDGTVNVFDPRCANKNNTAESSSTSSKFTAHKGKSNLISITSAGNTNLMFTTGQSTMRERELALWDIRKMSTTPIKRERLDVNTGLLTPLYDTDTNLLALCGKGDMNMRFYELTNGSLYPLNNVAFGGDIQRHVAMIPKRACDVMDCEVTRVLKLTNDSIQSVTLKVPKRDKRKFCEDIFPPSSAFKAAIESEEWVSGLDCEPVLSAVEPIVVDESVAVMPESSSDNVYRPSLEVISPCVSTSRLSAFNNHASHFRHVHGVIPTKTEMYFNLSPNISTMDSPLLAANEKFFALPWQGGGGQVYVSTLANNGKVEPDCAHLNTGHKGPVCTLTFSQFDANLLLTGSDDCTIRLFKLNDEGVGIGTAESDDHCASVFKGHHNSVRSLDFHPTCANIFMSSSMDHTVKLWDIGHSSAPIIDLSSHHTMAINNCCWNFNGSLIVTGSRDKQVRLIDPRSNTIVHQGQAHTGARGPRVCWCEREGSEGLGTLLTVGTGFAGDRQLCLWDPRNMAKAYCTKSVDDGNGVLYPFFDEATGLAFLAGRGDRNIKYYEISNAGENEGFDAIPCHEFISDGLPMIGIAKLPHKMMDVANVEVARFLKLSSDEVSPLSFLLPRNNELQHFFQDDVYKKLRSTNVPAVKVEDWVKGENGNMVFESLRPEGMPLASERVVVEEAHHVRKIDIFRDQIRKEEEDKVDKDKLLLKMQQMAIEHEEWHPNTTGRNSSGSVVRSRQSSVVDAVSLYDSSDDDWDD